ncbi:MULTISPECIES: isoprenylcysteine carboxylmethyltransferase family protein [unclassified Mesorhizobium]|jgi:protein-S-isoprenylcysteine O-methyltransferase Ste14|uniref:methyltransferase family protein n=2 Tax=Mesorhizobium TaxID=68287 RepID=UPI000FDB694E|nr:MULTISPECIES: isoprenylcysteine carboxylmethyltransferase family protein [unclassified Mesorhizobium]RWL49206.1 MAG: isoprenylcysteine carboxylmethyltransferase family protein [Mesorhizobium sp.]TGQ08728.1 isoprenylcysteine carboxylmethyltransferase family protein [Mesorhizobium sp. M2E.F.Ca.ET.219.01.1.1]TGT69263.1 isoprenylcysteine carboxylmethyltransferase family protein [Mesorhizobium sp. M2E.F.Ca.ET.166.01.1.1]TGW01595.1 isoprenylcysteine carboxylmethyltransferase family protein [Mesorh
MSKSDTLPGTATGFLSDLQSHPVFVDLREGLFRFIALLVAAIFVYRGVNNVIVDPGRLNVLLLTISETLTFVWLLLARRPLVRDWSPFTVFIAVTAGFGSGFVSLQEGTAIIPLFIAAPLQFLALWLVIWGKMSLGRSFAILPANRGVVTGGAYRFVRHPIYAGYLAGHILFLLSSFSVYNFTVYAIITLFQVHRILREERILALTEEYRDYLGRVRYRLCPGIF